MGNILYREAVIADAAELCRLEECCFTTDRISYRQFRYQLSRGTTVYQLSCACETGMITGYGVCFVPSGRHTARLYSLAVLPQYRGQGIACALLQRLLAQVKRRGFSHCNLEVRCSDSRTQKLYAHFNFRVIQRLEEYYADGEAALRMRAEL